MSVGSIAEKFVKQYYKHIFKKVIPKFANVLSLDYYENDYAKELQRKGIDGFIESIIPFEVKTRDHKYYQNQDILLEIMAENENNKLGWLYTSESKIIVYLWYNEKRDYFIDGYLLFLENIRKWLPGREGKYQKGKTTSASGNYKWTTISLFVPIKDFPNNCLERIPVKTFSKRIKKTPRMAIPPTIDLGEVIG